MEAVSRPFGTESADRERSKRRRLLRRARFPVVKSLDGYESVSALSSDGTSASSGSDTKAMKKTSKKTEVKAVEYAAAEGSVMEGDYVL